MSSHLQSFLLQIKESFKNQQLIKISLGNKRDKDAILKNIFIKPIKIKTGLKLSFTYRNNTQDIFKNYDLNDGIILIEKMLQTHFYNADLFTLQNDFHLSTDKNEKIKIISKPPSLLLKEDALQHDKIKNRIIETDTAPYLTDLGITTTAGQVKKDMQDKFKQINHYVQIIDGIVKDIDFGNTIAVADMGSGKGYLTFALYDYLKNKLKVNANIVGIEIREDLIHKCNQIAKSNNYQNLQFIKGTIQDANITYVDMLIALHACDTATDDAIYKGIQANAKIIVCAPCCHKQIRKQLTPTNELKSITKHGILLERQAEIITDTIRALILEAHGYKTKVFEFIATEHTPKNILIVGTKTNNTQIAKQQILNKIDGIKKVFNINTHYLETLLNN